MNISVLERFPHLPATSGLEGLTAKVSVLADCLRRSNAHLGHRAGYADGAIIEMALEAAHAADHKIAELNHRLGQLQRLALTDELTGLLNRRGFEDELRRALASAGRHDENGALIYIDLDGFKPVNDTYGHAAGDEVLKTVARLIRGNVRDTDYIGRLGGDEFAILMTRTSWENALKRAEAIDASLNQSIIDWQGRMIAVRASLGIQHYGPKDEGVDLLRRADASMYKTKRLRADLRRPILLDVPCRDTDRPAAP